MINNKQIPKINFTNFKHLLVPNFLFGNTIRNKNLENSMKKY